MVVGDGASHAEKVRFRAYAAPTDVEDIHDDKLLMQCVAEREERRQHIGCGRQL